MKKLLITGSCGFLFSNFIRKVIYNKLEYSIFSIDSISNNILSNIYQNKNHSFYIGNCDNSHLLNIIMMSDKPDILIHGAFDSTISKNIEITSKLLECAKNNKVERFIYISSDEVYGSKCFSFDENYKELNPVTEVGLSKLLCENFVKEYCRRNNINYTIVRVGQFFGPRQSKEEFLVKNFKELNNSELILNTNNVYSYGYVTDAVNGLLKIIELDGLNQIYNLSGGINISQKEILEELALVLDKKVEIKDNSTNNFKFKIESFKLKDSGWTPEFDLKNSLDLFSQWYLNNNWWFK
jgi:dTDP-glucose 4,6-dehydratase